MNMFAKLWNDETGAVLTFELLFVNTLMVIGLTVGYASLRNALVTELADLAAAIEALDFGVAPGSGDVGPVDATPEGFTTCADVLGVGK